MSRRSALILGVAIAIVVGLAIVVLRLAEPSRSFASIASYDLLEDGRTVVLAIGVGRLDSIGYVAADEDASSVRVRVLLLHHTGSAPADLLLIDVRTVLGSALGSRIIVDQDGRLVPRRAR
jgi:hypothetical protein